VQEEKIHGRRDRVWEEAASVGERSECTGEKDRVCGREVCKARSREGCVVKSGVVGGGCWGVGARQYLLVNNPVFD